MEYEIKQMDQESKKASLHPWPTIISLLHEQESDVIISIIDRAGLQVDWSTTFKTHKERKREYRPRIQSAFDVLPEDDKLRATWIVANELTALNENIAEKVDESLKNIGWRIESGTLTTDRGDIKRMFFRDGKELEQKFKILLSLSQAQIDFDHWLADARNESLEIAILFLDIDNFKQLNTKYTESKVDKTLLPEAQCLIRKLTLHRGEAYRYGGEEFLVILPNHSAEEAMIFAEKVREQFESHTFNVDDGSEGLTISVGVAVWPSHGSDFDSVLQSANQAEHKAKQEGRNCVRLSLQQNGATE